MKFEPLLMIIQSETQRCHSVAVYQIREKNNLFSSEPVKSQDARDAAKMLTLSWFDVGRIEQSF